MFRINKPAIQCIFVILAVLLSILCCTAFVSAQNDAGEILDLLKQGASDYKGLGSYLWNQTHGSYTNLGDFAACELEKFLKNGVEQTFELDGKETTVKITPKENSTDEFNIELTQDGNTEQGTLKIETPSIKDYVNHTLYPSMQGQLTGPVSDSVQMVKDTAKLLVNSIIAGKTIIPDMNDVWAKLTGNMDEYPAIKTVLEKPSASPLLTITIEQDDAGTGNLNEIFTNVQSSANLVTAFETINVNPVPEVELDTDQEPEISPSPAISPSRPSLDFLPLLNEQLPATGFSASHVTALKARPQNLSYGSTGYTLQIPELDVAESIVSVPLSEGNYPVEWLENNIGLLEQSSLPGQGITVLTGHNHLNTMEIGPFLFISSLKEGDRLFVTDAGQNIQSFKVYGNYKIASDGFASIADDLKENALVLITCEDESASGGYLNRRVIFAEPL